MRLLIRTGPDALVGLGRDLDELLRDTAAPVTARLTWWSAWAAGHLDHDPWVLAVTDGQRWCGVAPLARRTRRSFHDIVLLGHGASDHARLPARDASTAAELAGGLADRLNRLRLPWRLTAEQLPENDPVVEALAAVLPASAVVEGVSCPTVRFGRDRSVGSYASKSYRGRARNMWNRLERDGHEPRVQVHRTREEIATLLPRIEAIASWRQVEIAGRSHLEDPAFAAFFRAVLLAHSDRGELEVLTLSAGRDLAAYSVGFLDGRAYRQWNKHFDPAWTDYRVGHVLDHHLLRRVLDDAGFDELDWMKGVEPYKLRTATDVVPTWTLLAWSSAASRVAIGAPRLAREWLRPVVRAKPALHRSVMLARTVTRLVRRRR